MVMMMMTKVVMMMMTMVVMQLFKTKFFLEYLVSWYGLVHYFLPGLGTRSALHCTVLYCTVLYCTVLCCTRRRIMAELRSMFRASISEHRNTLDPNHPR